MNPYIPHTDKELNEMLSVIGLNHLDDLFKDIPDDQRPRSFDIDEGKTEFDVKAYFKTQSRMNDTHLIGFLGGGYYDHEVPSVIDALASRSEFYTAYTPYQPECSQGTLQSLYEFQSSICTLTGMDVSNASLYDGGTALFEAVLMAMRINPKRQRVIVDQGLNPIYQNMLHSYFRYLNVEIVTGPERTDIGQLEALNDLIDDQTLVVILQNPNFYGVVEDLTPVSEVAHQHGALVIHSIYPIACGLLKTPAEMGADIVTAEGQSLGIALNFGGPYLGLMSTRKKFIRKMPGRIIGKTVDKNGKICYVNTLQAREQHIRRDKATSNICTNVSLCALQAQFYMSVLGGEGLKSMSTTIFKKSEWFKDQLRQISGVTVTQSGLTFNEFMIALPIDAEEVFAEMLKKGFACGYPLGRYFKKLSNSLLIAVTEKRTRHEMLNFVDALQAVIRQHQSLTNCRV